MTIGRDAAARGAGHRPQAAEVGSGVAGLTAAYLLQQAYDATLYEWRGQFNDAAAAVSELGFGPVFRRMWDLYLAYSEAGFRAGYLDVHQLVLERGAP